MNKINNFLLKLARMRTSSNNHNNNNNNKKLKNLNYAGNGLQEQMSQIQEFRAFIWNLLTNFLLKNYI